MKYIALAILSVAILSVVLGYVHAFGDDGDVCANGGGSIGENVLGLYCYVQQIYHQNQVLIQQNHQLIKLTEWNFCKPYSDETFFMISQNQFVTGDPKACVDEIDGDTK